MDMDAYRPSHPYWSRCGLLLVVALAVSVFEASHGRLNHEQFLKARSLTVVMF